MLQSIVQLKDLLPQGSLFRYPGPAVLLLVPFLISILGTTVLFALALQSANVFIPWKRKLLPGAVLGALVFLVRQLIAIPFHVLIVVASLIVTVKYIGRTSLKNAVIGSLFAEVIIIVGSIVFFEPLLILVFKGQIRGFLGSPLGFSMAASLEAILPAITLAVMARNKWALTKWAAVRERETEMHEDE